MLPKVLSGYSGGRLPGRSTKEKGREEEKPDEGREERQIRSEIAKEVVAGMKEKAGEHEDAKATAQWTVGKVSSKIGTARKSQAGNCSRSGCGHQGKGKCA